MKVTSMIKKFRVRSQQSKSNTARLRFEVLEMRDVPSGTTIASPSYRRATSSGGNLSPMSGSATPTGTTPAQVRQAYGFDQLSFKNSVNQTIAADGTGTTIAIVAAYDNPNIASDLHQFDVAFGLPDPVFTKLNQNGVAGNYPAADAGWITEIALDVQWAHAIAPGANILLVEANSASFADLSKAVDTARKYPGVVAVSMSWGGSEFSTQSTYDSYFTTPAGHQGVTFLASSGDTGAPVSYPAISPNIVSVGGTTLNQTNGSYLGETGWNGSGGGLSAYYSQPSYQKGVVTQSTTKRTNPDVAYDSDPNTGFPVYDSYNNGTSTPWGQWGGTSAAAPQWAGLFSIANQGRLLNGLGSLDGVSQSLPRLYTAPQSHYHDITTGTSNGNPRYSAGVGYDLVTGRGSPIANLIIGDLVGLPTNPPTPTSTVRYTVSAASTTVAGSTVNVTVKALNADGTQATNYTGTVHLSSTDLIGVLPADYTFSSTDAGSHTFQVTLKTAGAQSVTVTDKDNSSIVGSSTITVTPGVATQLIFKQQPSNTAVNAKIAPAVTVAIADAFGNIETADNSNQVSLKLASNPGKATLTGGSAVTVKAGIATFSGLSLNVIGNGYTFSSTSGNLPSSTSSSFNIVSATTVLDNFDNMSESWNITGGWWPTASYGTAANLDAGSTNGLIDSNGNDAIYRTDAAAQVKPGQSLSVWLKFANLADGRAYFNFGSTSAGTLALVAAPNSGQLIIQNISNWNTYQNLAVVNQSYAANTWYRLEVNWAANGNVTGKIFKSDGTTLLNSLTASTAGTGVTGGGFGFRAIGNDKYWDTVTLGTVSGFAAQSPKPQSLKNRGTTAQSKLDQPTSKSTSWGDFSSNTLAAAIYGSWGGSNSWFTDSFFSSDPSKLSDFYWINADYLLGKANASKND